MEASFGYTVSGALKLKGIDLSSSAAGGKKKKKKDKKRKKGTKDSSSEAAGSSLAGRKRSRETDASHDADSSGVVGARVFRGAGSVTVAGTVVTGIGTKFLSELRDGDAIKLEAPSLPYSPPSSAATSSSSGASTASAAASSTSSGEVRVVKHVFSDTQMKISSPFPGTHTTPVPYTCMTLPRKVETEADRQAKEKRRRLAEESAAAGTYGGAGGHVLTFREKKAGTSHGSYRIVTKKLDGPISREELLQMRAKKKSDRYCM